MKKTYIVAIKYKKSPIRLFGFKTLKARAAFLKEASEKFPGAEYATAEK